MYLSVGRLFFFSVERGERCICAYCNTQRNTAGRINTAHFILQDTRGVLLHNQIRQMQFHRQTCFLISRILCMYNNLGMQTQTKKNPVTASIKLYYQTHKQITIIRERVNNCTEWLVVLVVVLVLSLCDFNNENIFKVLEATFY